MVDNFHKPHENIRLRAYCGSPLCLFLDGMTVKRVIAQGFPFNGLGKLGSLSSGLVLRLMAECSFPLWCQNGRVGRRGPARDARIVAKGQASPPALVGGLPQP